jgi:hypothetical protein
VKTVNQKRLQEGKANHLPAGVNIANLPHSQPAWVGLRQVQDHPFKFADPTPDPTPDPSDGLGSTCYTQEEVDALSGTKGFMYIRWLGLYIFMLHFLLYMWHSLTSPQTHNTYNRFAALCHRCAWWHSTQHGRVETHH